MSPFGHSTPEVAETHRDEKNSSNLIPWIQLLIVGSMGPGIAWEGLLVGIIKVRLNGVERPIILWVGSFLGQGILDCMERRKWA